MYFSVVILYYLIQEAKVIYVLGSTKPRYTLELEKKKLYNINHDKVKIKI